MLGNLPKTHEISLENDLALILLAAGYSSRMQAFKPLLPLGNSTVIETAVDTFLNAGIKDITVVIGYKADQLKPVLNRKGIKWVYNGSYSEGMYSSVRAGVQSLPHHVKGFFLLPVDIPLIKIETIKKLSNAYLQSNFDIIYPVFNDRRGHPPIISSGLFYQIITHDGTGGLRALLAEYENKAQGIEVEDEGIHLDMDTYEEYLNLCDKIGINALSI